jgi:hypothetical protein
MSFSAKVSIKTKKKEKSNLIFKISLDSRQFNKILKRLYLDLLKTDFLDTSEQYTFLFSESEKLN